MAEPDIVVEPEPVTSPELVTVTEPPIAPIIIPKPATVQPLPMMAVKSPVAAVVVCAALLIQTRKGNIDTALFTGLYPTPPAALRPSYLTTRPPANAAGRSG